MTKKTPALAVLCAVQFMLVLDDTVVNVALPAIRGELGFSAAGLAWVVNAYFLAFGGFLLLSGRAADLLGRRRAFLIGVTVFGVASLACGLAQEPWQLVAARFAQGMGSALASPAALSLITLMFPGEGERARAVGVWGAIAALGGTMGLVISGVLTDLTSWRWIFLINLPVAALALVLVPRLVGESRAARGARLDVPGALLGTAAVLALVYGLLQAEHAGWVSAAVLLPLLLAASLAAAFLVVESRTAQPLVPLAFLAVRIRAVANLSILLFSAAFYAMAFLLMVHLQTRLGYSALVAGVAYLPYGGGVLAGMWLSSRAVTRLGTRPALLVALTVSAAGLLLLSGVAPGDGYVSGVLPGMLVTSLGCGLSLPALTTAAVSGTTSEDAGVGSAVLTSVQQVGGAVGVALLVTLAAQRGYSFALVLCAALVALAAVLVAAALRPSRYGGRTETLKS
ncbi:MFS transporter [Nonomuraea endophytica]|uniref:MFS transporter n=1 Tax=Nonomuraea endophytica TaxID=714136 RepID=UPI0037C8D793